MFFKVLLVNQEVFVNGIAMTITCATPYTGIPWPKQFGLTNQNENE